jgi:hypothetical protein
MGWTTEGSEFKSHQEFSLLHVVQTDSGAHPGSYAMVPGVKGLSPEADHSSPTSAEVKKVWIYAYVFMA